MSPLTLVQEMPGSIAAWMADTAAFYQGRELAIPSPLLLLAVVAALAMWRLFLLVIEERKQVHSSVRKVTVSAAQQKLEQRYTAESAMDRIRRLPFEARSRPRLRSFIPFSDRQKWSESARKSRKQGDGLAKLHAPITAATSQPTGDLQVFELENASTGGAPSRTGSAEGSMTPRNLATRTLAHLQSIIGLTNPDALVELALLAEVSALELNKELQVSQAGEVPRELWVVASGSFVSSTTTLGGATDATASVVLAKHKTGTLLSSSLSTIAALTRSKAAISTTARAASKNSQVLRLPLTTRVTLLIGQQLLRSALIRTERIAIFTMAQSLGLTCRELQLPAAIAPAQGALDDKEAALLGVAHALGVKPGDMPELITARELARAESASKAELLLQQQKQQQQKQFDTDDGVDYDSDNDSSGHLDGAANSLGSTRVASRSSLASASRLVIEKRRFTVHGYETEGDSVASIGDKPMLYVVIGGGLRVLSSDGRCLLELGEGEAFGFSFCFGKEALTVNIVAATRSQIVRIAPSVARKMKDVRRRAVSRCEF